MKKIFSLILIVVCIQGFSQTGFPLTQSMANANTRLVVNGGLEAVRGLINGVFTDTTAANADKIDFYNGAQIWTRSDRNFWLRDSVLNMWIRIAKFSEVGGTDTHFGNTNLTQTGIRTYAGGAFNYTFNNLGTWEYNHGTTQRFIQEGNISITGGTTGGSGVPFITMQSDNSDFASFYSGINVPTYVSRINHDGNSSTGGVMTIRSSFGGSTHPSDIEVSADSITLKPLLGQLNIDSLRTQFGDTTTWKPLVWSPHQKAVKKFNSWGEIGIGGGAQTLQQVVDADNDLTDQSIAFGDQGYITWDYDNDGDLISQYNTGNNTIIFERPATGIAMQLRFSGLSATRLFDFPNYAGTIAVHPTIVGQAGKVLAVNGGETALEWISAGGGGGFDITSEENYQHYLDKLSSVYGAFYWVSSGTASAVQGFTNNTVPLGFLSAHELKTGTTTTGLACHYTQQGGTYAAIALSSSIRYNFRARVQIPVVSDGTETFEYYAGFMDDITGSANIVDGVYFTYTHSVSSGQWVCHTESNNTKTSTASGITMTAGQNYDLKITVFGGTALFYIDDVLVVTTATNVPDDDTNRITTIGDCIIKSAGTESRSVYVDVLAYGRRGN